MNQALLHRATPIPAEALMHDWWLALVASASGSISLLPDANVLYRQHAGNVVGARGAGLLAMLGRLLHPSRRGHSSCACFAQPSFSASKTARVARFSVQQVMRQRRLTRMWRLCSESELRRGQKTRPLANMGSLVGALSGSTATLLKRSESLFTPHYDPPRQSAGSRLNGLHVVCWCCQELRWSGWFRPRRLFVPRKALAADWARCETLALRRLCRSTLPVFHLVPCGSWPFSASVSS